MPTLAELPGLPDRRRRDAARQARRSAASGQRAVDARRRSPELAQIGLRATLRCTDCRRPRPRSAAGAAQRCCRTPPRASRGEVLVVLRGVASSRITQRPAPRAEARITAKAASSSRPRREPATRMAGRRLAAPVPYLTVVASALIDSARWPDWSRGERGPAGVLGRRARPRAERAARRRLGRRGSGPGRRPARWCSPSAGSGSRTAACCWSRRAPDAIFLGLVGERPLFATDAASGEPERGHPAGLREAATELPAEEAALGAYAASLLSWHRRHRFCANCGAPDRAGRRRPRAPLPRLRHAPLPAHRPGRDRARGRRARPAAARAPGQLAGGALLGPGRLRGAGRDARGGGPARGARGVGRGRGRRPPTSRRSRGRSRAR